MEKSCTAFRHTNTKRPYFLRQRRKPSISRRNPFPENGDADGPGPKGIPRGVAYGVQAFCNLFRPAPSGPLSLISLGMNLSEQKMALVFGRVPSKIMRLAGNSVLESFKELSMFHPVKILAQQHKTLMSTNPFESMFPLVRQNERKIKLTRGSARLQHWLGRVLL